MFNLSGIFKVLKQVNKESLTSAAGIYDPARVFGYGFVTTASLVFLILAGYDTVKNGHFNITEFCTGVITLAGGFLIIAGGVAVKKGAENTPVDNPTPPPQ